MVQSRVNRRKGGGCSSVDVYSSQSNYFGRIVVPPPRVDGGASTRTEPDFTDTSCSDGPPQSSAAGAGGGARPRGPTTARRPDTGTSRRPTRPGPTRCLRRPSATRSPTPRDARPGRGPRGRATPRRGPPCPTLFAFRLPLPLFPRPQPAPSPPRDAPPAPECPVRQSTATSRSRAQSCRRCESKYQSSNYTTPSPTQSAVSRELVEAGSRVRHEARPFVTSVWPDRETPESSRDPLCTKSPEALVRLVHEPLPSRGGWTGLLERPSSVPYPVFPLDAPGWG